MIGRTFKVAIEITKVIRDDNPDIVECRLLDASGKHWTFHEKMPIVTVHYDSRAAAFPTTGVIAGEVIRESESCVVLDTTKPWGIESLEGCHQFEVFKKILIE